jgi:hypothetical protein
MKALYLLLLLFGMFAAFMVWVGFARTKQFVDRLFSKSEFTGDALIVITSALTDANDRGGDYTFGIERASALMLRGQPIWIVWGPVGSTVPGKYGPTRSRWERLYAVASTPEQSDWMRHNSDLFLPVSDDSSFPIFWLEISTLRANLAVLSETNSTSSSAGSEPDRSRSL